MYYTVLTYCIILYYATVIYYCTVLYCTACTHTHTHTHPSSLPTCASLAASLPPCPPLLHLPARSCCNLPPPPPSRSCLPPSAYTPMPPCTPLLHLPAGPPPLSDRARTLRTTCLGTMSHFVMTPPPPLHALAGARSSQHMTAPTRPPARLATPCSRSACTTCLPALYPFSSHITFLGFLDPSTLAPPPPPPPRSPLPHTAAIKRLLHTHLLMRHTAL